MSKLPAGPSKGPYTSSGTKVADTPPPASSGGLPFGLRRNHLIGIALAAVVAVGLVAWNPFGGSDEDAAAVGKKGKGKGKGKADAKAARNASGICQIVECTDEQRAAIKPLLQGYQQAVAADEKGLREAYAQLATAFTEEEYDDTTIDEAWATVSGHQSAIDREARKALAEVHEVLTPEQREAIAKQVARDGPASVFDKGGRGGAERPGRAEKRRAKRAISTDRPGSDAARKMMEMGGAAKRPAEPEIDREADPEAEEPEGEEEKPRRPNPAAPI